jgi:hypothetical protein
MRDTINVMELKKDEKMLGGIAASLIGEEEGICPTDEWVASRTPNPEPRTPEITCPTDEEVALYREGRLSKEKRRTIVSHFVSCGECQDMLTIPMPPSEAAKGTKAREGFLSSLWRPLIAVPAAAVFVVLLVFTLNVYLEPGDISERDEAIYRGVDFVSKPLSLTPNLLAAIREGDEETLKNELAKELPPDAKVSHVVVEDIKRFKEAKEEDRIKLILYSDGLLKIKLKE